MRAGFDIPIDIRGRIKVLSIHWTVRGNGLRWQLTSTIRAVMGYQSLSGVKMATFLYGSLAISQ